jgi:hypothetical protein
MVADDAHSPRRRAGWRAWRHLWGRPVAAPDLDPDRSDLVVVAACFDDAEACSATLGRASATAPRWDPDRQVVLRHHLLLPAQHVDDAPAVARQDGYVARMVGLAQRRDGVVLGWDALQPAALKPADPAHPQA